MGRIRLLVLVNVVLAVIITAIVGFIVKRTVVGRRAHAQPHRRDPFRQHTAA